MINFLILPQLSIIQHILHDPPMTSDKNRETWIDVTRVIALLLLVATHCSNPNEYWGSIYLCLLRPCVPLFVMITGYLLLPVEQQELGRFYSKRIFRVLWPFLIWSVLYNTFPWVVFHFSATPEVGKELMLSFFPFASDTNGSWQSAVYDVIRIPFDFSAYTETMWYVFVLIGLYLFMPFISPWIQKTTSKQMAWFLGICAATTFLPLLRYYGGFYKDPAYLQSGHIFGFCDWNDNGMLCYFTGFLGYLVLGRVLGNMKEMSWKKTLSIALPLIIVGYLLTFKLFHAIKAVPDCTDSMLEQPIFVTSFNVVMMTVGVFLIGKKCHVTGALARWCGNVGICCFGMYMCHYFFVGSASTFCSYIGLPISILIPASTLLAFCGAWLFVSLLKKFVGPLKWFLG